MNSIKKTAILMLISSLTFLFAVSCQKDEEDKDYSASQDNSIAEAVFNDVANIVDDAYSNGNTSKSPSTLVIIGPCATITLDTLASPRALTIDFGASPCLCNDGRYRSGKIIATFTGRYFQVGTIITISFDNYVVNDYIVSGTKTITNMGLNTAGNPYFQISVTGAIEKPNNGGTISWTASRIREWVAGFGTLPLTDDVYLITGSGSGTSATGTAYTITITKALRKEIGCKNIVSGTFDLSISGKAKRTVDYGDGTCDNVVTVKILNKTYTFYLS
ncbi:MAG: hypothetical protein JXR34_12835 [Bacteroidales bacterium]|nr:hypothetical protein [Bacteroidales bacterium]